MRQSVTCFLLAAWLALIATALADETANKNDLPLVKASLENKIDLVKKQKPPTVSAPLADANEVVKKGHHHGRHHNRRLDGNHHKQRGMMLEMMMGHLNRAMTPEDAKGLRKKALHLNIKAIKKAMGKFAKTKRGRHMLKAMKVWKRHHGKKVHVAKKSHKKDKN